MSYWIPSRMIFSKHLKPTVYLLCIPPICLHWMKRYLRTDIKKNFLYMTMIQTKALPTAS